MKMVFTLDIEDNRVKNHLDAAKLLKLMICDVEQGRSGGFIRNNETGEEKERWSVEIVR